jgi:PilZ domain
VLQIDVIRLTHFAFFTVIEVTRNPWRGIAAAQYRGVETRRRTQRFTLSQPVPARANSERAVVVDVSINGCRLRHSGLIPTDHACAIALEWHGLTIEFVAEPRWTNSDGGGQYQSGFQIQSIDPTSAVALRKLIETSVQPLYECHELLHGVWRKRMTTDSQQPAAGFTVSWTESVHTIDFFRAAYMGGDRRMRERIRKLAEMSIAHPERRYDDA